MIDLGDILQRYPDCLHNRALFKSTLKDIYPDEERMINLLAIIYECGLANKIKGMSAIDTDTMQIMLQTLESRYGVSLQYSEPAIRVWARAYGILTEKTDLPPAPSPVSALSPEDFYAAGDYNLIRKEDGWYISGLNELEVDEISIPGVIGDKNIVGIAPYAFAKRKDIRKVNISDNITVIDEGAFSRCAFLESVSFPRSIKRIEAKAFKNSGIRHAFLGGSIDYIAPQAFADCKKLSSVSISNSVKNVEPETFSGCDNLCMVTLPKSLKRIKTAAFKNCKRLSRLWLPDGTKTIEKEAFVGSILSDIAIPPSVTNIGNESSAPELLSSATKSERPLGNVTTIYCKWGSLAYEYAERHNVRIKDYEKAKF